MSCRGRRARGIASRACANGLIASTCHAVRRREVQYRRGAATSGGHGPRGQLRGAAQGSAIEQRLLLMLHVLMLRTCGLAQQGSQHRAVRRPAGAVAAAAGRAAASHGEPAGLPARIGPGKSGRGRMPRGGYWRACWMRSGVAAAGWTSAPRSAAGGVLSLSLCRR